MKHGMTAGSHRMRAKNQHLRDITGQEGLLAQLPSRGHVVLINRRFQLILHRAADIDRASVRD